MAQRTRKQGLLALAQEQQRAVLRESREDAFERKLKQRSKDIELAHAKIKKFKLFDFNT